MFRKMGSVGEHQHPTFFAKFLADQVELTLTDGSRNPSWRQQKSIEVSFWICLNDFLEGTYHTHRGTLGLSVNMAHPDLLRDLGVQRHENEKHSLGSVDLGDFPWGTTGS